MAYTPSVQDRSGEILAQGFSSLVQGVQGYAKKKEEKEILDSTINSLMSRAASSTKLANYLGIDMTDANAVKAGVKAAGGGDAVAGARMLRQSLQQFGEFERQEKEREDDDFAFGVGMKAKGAGRDPYAAIAQAGGNMSIRVAKVFSDLNANDAAAEERRAAAARVPKPEKVFQQMTLDQINDLKGKGYDVKARPVANGMYEVENVSPFAPGAVTNINTGDKAFEATVGKSTAERLANQYDAAKLASRTAIPKLDQTLSVLQNQEPNTGILAELATNVDRVRATLLNEKGAAKRVSDTQLLESMLGSDVFTSMGAINLGARNIDTPKEREFLQKVITGEIKLEKSTLIKMTEMRRKYQSQIIDNYNEDVKNGDYEEYFKAARMKPHTFDVPAIGGTTPPPPMSSGVPLPPGWTRNK